MKSHDFDEGARSLELGLVDGDAQAIDALRRRLQALANLEALSFQVPYPQSKAAIDLVHGLTGLRELQMHGFTEGEDISAIGSCVGLRNLRLAGLYRVDVAPLAALTALEELRISGDIKNLKALAPLHKLVRIEFMHCKNVDLQTFSGSDGLRWLGLTGSKVRDFAALKSFPALQRLDVPGTNLESLAQVPALPRLDWLWISGCRKLHSLDGIDRFPALEMLDLSELKSVDSLHPLAALSRLKFLSLRETQVADGDLAPIEKMRSLETLLIGGNSGAGVLDVAKRMTWCQVTIQGTTDPVVEVHHGIPLLKDPKAKPPVFRIQGDFAGDLGFETNDDLEAALLKRLKRDAPDALAAGLELDSEASSFVAYAPAIEPLRAVATALRGLGKAPS